MGCFLQCCLSTQTNFAIHFSCVFFGQECVELTKTGCFTLTKLILPFSCFATGETQKNGKWEEEEKELFFKRYYQQYGDAKIPITEIKWGIFSRGIPGRVGYQCAAFMRSLIKAGEWQDPNYAVHDGKLVFLGKNSKCPCLP